MKQEAAAILSRCFADLDVRPFLVQTAHHLNVSPAEIINWFNQWDRESLRSFAGMGLHLLRPDGNGKYKTSLTPQTPSEPFSMRTIGDLVRLAKMAGPPIPTPAKPDTRSGHK